MVGFGFKQAWLAVAIGAKADADNGIATNAEADADNGISANAGAGADNGIGAGAEADPGAAAAGLDVDRILAALGLRDLGTVDWRQGIDLAYLTDDRLAITPPLGGAPALTETSGTDWILVAGRAFFAEDAMPDVVELSATLDTEVQFFATHRVVEAHYWERAVAGRLVRAFRYVGETGEVTRWLGDPDATEARIGLPAAYDIEAAPEDRPDVMVDEADVMTVAAAWSVDPSELDARPAPGPLRVAAR